MEPDSQLVESAAPCGRHSSTRLLRLLCVLAVVLLSFVSVAAPVGAQDSDGTEVDSTEVESTDNSDASDESSSDSGGSLTKWIAVAAAVVLGFVLGLILSALVRRVLGKPGGDPKLVEVAPVVASGVLYVCLIAGMWIALAISSPDAVADVPEKVINSIPNVVVALILVLGARVLGSVVSVIVGQSLEAATGARNPAVEKGVGGVILGVGVVLALDQLGVSTTIINIMVSGIVFAAALSFALLVGFGGRSVARDISAGRALRNTLVPGAKVRAGVIEGVIAALNPVAVEVETETSETVHVPYHLLLESTIEVSNPTAASDTVA